MKEDTEVDIRRVCEAMGRPYPTVEELGVTEEQYAGLSLEEQKGLEMAWFRKWVSTLSPREARKMGGVISMIMLEDKDFKKAFKRDARKRMKNKVRKGGV